MREQQSIERKAAHRDAEESRAIFPPAHFRVDAEMKRPEIYQPFAGRGRDFLGNAQLPQRGQFAGLMKSPQTFRAGTFLCQNGTE